MAMDIPHAPHAPISTQYYPFILITISIRPLLSFHYCAIFI
jgi:hypothetical protein